MMRVSGNTSCSGEIEYYCRRCDLVIIYDTTMAAINEKKSEEHTTSLRRLREEMAARKPQPIAI